MEPLIVRYTPQWPAVKKPDTLIIMLTSAELFAEWIRWIDQGRVNEVILCSPAACTGWRIRVKRTVHFHERPVNDDEDARHQEQAKYRILEHDLMVPETISPYNLIQEWVKHDDHYYPWRVLVTCVLLNKTNGRQVRPIFARLFEEYPTPDSIINAWRENLVAILRPLGLQNVRANRLQQLSSDFIQRVPMTDMRGVGQYAMDAYALFCEARLDVTPQDTWLQPYLEWRKAGGPPVYWPAEDFKIWWTDGRVP